MSRRYRDFRIDRVDRGVAPAAVEPGLLHATPFYALRAFPPSHPVSGHPPVLLVPPLSGHFPVMLRDMIVGLLPDFPVAVLDWADIRHVPAAHGAFEFDANVAAIRDAIRRIGPDVAVVAVCQAGVPALAAVADLSARRPAAAPALLALIAAPIDPLANPTPVVELIRSLSAAWYRTVPLERLGAGVTGRGRLVYPARRQLRGLRRYLARQVAIGGELARKMRADDGANPERAPFPELYLSLMDLDARHFAANIETVFLRRDLPRGRLAVDTRPIDPRAIVRTALLSIEGACDDIAAPGQTRAALSLLGPARPGPPRAAVVIPACGHFGLFHGAVWRGRVLPVLRAHCLRRTGGP